MVDYKKNGKQIISVHYRNTYGLSFLIFISVMIFSCTNHNVKQDPSPTKTIQEQYRIALFPLHTLTDNVKVFSDEIEDRLTANLLNTNIFKVLERKMIDKIIEEMKLQVSDLMDISKSIEVGKLIGAQYIIVGSISSFQNKLMLSVRILDVETGRILSISIEKGNFSNIDIMVKKCSERLIYNFVTR